MLSKIRFTLVIILSALLLPATIFSLPAQAEQCLNQIPDSAWDKSTPGNLDLQGISTRFSAIRPFANINLYQNVPIEYKFEYLGANCTLRTIRIKTTFSSDIRRFSLENFIAMFKNSTSDLFAAEDRISNLRKAATLATNQRLYLNAIKDLTGVLDWKSWSNQPFSKIVGSIVSSGFPTTDWNNYLSVIALDLGDGCLVAQSEYGDTKFAKHLKFVPLGPPTFNAIDESPAPITLKMNDRFCKSRISLILLPSDDKNVRNFGEKTTIVVDIADVNVEALSTQFKKLTITCVKGKLIKKVTDVNPKCPTGYSKK